MENTHNQRIPTQPNKHNREPETDIVEGARNEDQLDALHENAGKEGDSQTKSEIPPVNNGQTPENGSDDPAFSNPNNGDISNPLTRGI